jgi:hypothetical protein
MLLPDSESGFKCAMVSTLSATGISVLRATVKLCKHLQGTENRRPYGRIEV